MRTRFFRSRNLELFFQSPRVATARGLFFDLTLGLEGPIDPDSGMIVNLVQVDQVLDRLSKHLQGQTWTEEEEALRDLFGLLDSLFLKLVPAHWIEISLRRDGVSWSFLSSDRGRLSVSREERIESVEGSQSREKVIETVTRGPEVVLRSERRPGGSIKLSRS